MKLSIFNIVNKHIKFYSQNTNLLPPKPKTSFRHLRQGIQEFHRKYVGFQLTRAQTMLLLFVGYTILTRLNRNLTVPRLTKKHLLMRSLKLIAIQINCLISLL